MSGLHNEIERKDNQYVNIPKDSIYGRSGNENRCVELDFPFHFGFDYALTFFFTVRQTNTLRERCVGT
jgi:hypothetical protein